MRTYLVQNTGIGDKIVSWTMNDLDALLRNQTIPTKKLNTPTPPRTVFLDAAILNIATPLPINFNAGTYGYIDGDLGVIKLVGYGDLKTGDVYYWDNYLDTPPAAYGTKAYIVMEKHKPSDVDVLCDPQPVRETPYNSKKPITTTFTNPLPTSRWLVSDGQLYVNPTFNLLYLRCPTTAANDIWVCTHKSVFHVIYGNIDQSVYLEARDPRCNTKWSYGDQEAWTFSNTGSMGIINPDWWKSVPDAPTWAAGIAAKIGDRFAYNCQDYEVIKTHTTAAASTPDKTPANYSPILLSESCGRDYWLAKTNEDAVAKPVNGVMAAQGITTASQMVSTYIRPSTAFIRYGKPWSLWEIGAIGRAEPWRTIRLVDGTLTPSATALLGSYEFGDWMLLDELSLHPTDAVPAACVAGDPFPYKSERGKINVNPDTVSADGIRQVLSGLVSMSTKDRAAPVEAYCHLGVTIPSTVCPVMSPTLFDPLALAIPGSIAQPTGAARGAPLLSRGELGVRQTGAVPSATVSGLAMVDWYNVNGYATDLAGRNIRQLDRCREELIGKSANLFQTRYQYFEIIASGRSQKEKPEGTGAKTMVTLAEQKVTAVVERDTYTGKVRLFVGGRPQE